MKRFFCLDADQKLNSMEYSKKRILIVDDDQDLRLILRDLLEFQGYICEEVENGEDALQLLHFHDFDLIITDYEMPQMNGILLLKKLAENPNYAEIPVIMMTGLYSEEFGDKARQAGAYAVLEKPYSRKNMLSLINQALNSYSCTCPNCY